MPFLFSYGTLQQADVQLLTFGRRLTGERDELPGYEQSLVAIDDAQRRAALGKNHHANVAVTGRHESRVIGTVLEIGDAELAVADDYARRDSYRRVAVTLVSGKRAWVYTFAGSEGHAE
jgi:gamma-glutamylcyclotransferase (GGCT)/AIG2-like uncharacterized protein YtfP